MGSTALPIAYHILVDIAASVVVLPNEHMTLGDRMPAAVEIICCHPNGFPFEENVLGGSGKLFSRRDALNSGERT